MLNRNFTHLESVRFLAQVDPDLLLADSYIMKLMTPEEAGAFETRLGVDIALFEKVWPMIMIARLERSPVAAQARASTAEVLAISRPPQKMRLAVRLARLAAAGAVITVTGLGLFEGYFPVAAWYNYRVERREGRALTTDIVRPVVWASWELGSPKIMPIPQGSVALGPDTRTTRPLKKNTPNAVLALDGEALITILPQHRRAVRTATAQIELDRGYFRITSIPGSGSTTLIVYEGSAAVDRFPATPGAVPPTEVPARHRAVIGRNHSIVVDSIAGDAAPKKDFLTRFRERGKP
jgi:hypothetical protein